MTIPKIKKAKPVIIRASGSDEKIVAFVSDAILNDTVKAFNFDDIIAERSSIADELERI